MEGLLGFWGLSFITYMLLMSTARGQSLIRARVLCLLFFALSHVCIACAIGNWARLQGRIFWVHLYCSLHRLILKLFSTWFLHIHCLLEISDYWQFHQLGPSTACVTGSKWGIVICPQKYTLELLEETWILASKANVYS